jgi:hypothetical protein
MVSDSSLDHGRLTFYETVNDVCNRKIIDPILTVFGGHGNLQSRICRRRVMVFDLDCTLPCYGSDGFFRWVCPPNTPTVTPGILFFT